jgi:transposase InsO family protein
MSKAEDPCAGVKEQIRSIYERHQGRYGYRRVAAQLRQDGDVVNLKKVQRLMQSMSL